MAAHHDIGIANGMRSKTSAASLHRRCGSINLWLLGGVFVNACLLSLLEIAWYLLSSFQPATSLGMSAIVGSATESLRQNEGGTTELDLISSRKLASLRPLPTPKKL